MLCPEIVPPAHPRLKARYRDLPGFFFGVGMSRKTVVRTLIAAAIAVSVFATVAYAMTWVTLHTGRLL
jgi:hypothetical protein